MESVPQFLIDAFPSIPRRHRLAHLNAWRESEGLSPVDILPADGTITADHGIVQNAEDAGQVQGDAEPGILTKALSFGKAIARHVASGLKETTSEQYAERLAVCEGCDQFKPNAGKPSCRKCGCSLPSKLRWASERCPLGFWDVVRTPAEDAGQ